MVPQCIPLNRLKKFAIDNALTCPETAAGLCMHVSFQLSRQAEILGLADKIRFVRWRIKGDPQFFEHWAIMLDDKTILDMSAVQFDSSMKCIRSINDYPKHFGSPKTYSHAELAILINNIKFKPELRYSIKFLLSLHAKLILIDLKKSLNEKNQIRLIHTLSSCTKEAVAISAHCLKRKLTRRKSTLMRRLINSKTSR